MDVSVHVLRMIVLIGLVLVCSITVRCLASAMFPGNLWLNRAQATHRQYWCFRCLVVLTYIESALRIACEKLLVD